jgi:predicted CXXCH cytochrome family protein
MFKTRLTGLTAAAVTSLLWAGIVSAQGITGSAHDFSGENWSGDAICIVCHTPHDSDPSVAAEAPLWNHALTTETFTLYSSTSLQGTVSTTLNTRSILCLSCHDGVTALDSFGGATGSTVMTGGEVLDTDLSNDHPVSITYTATTASNDGGLHDPTTTTVAVSGTSIQQYMLSGGDSVECSSCHDVHNGTGFGSLLKVENAGSQLCFTCHDK